jgi:hypothetical protein
MDQLKLFGTAQQAATIPALDRGAAWAKAVGTSVANVASARIKQTASL